MAWKLATVLLTALALAAPAAVADDQPSPEGSPPPPICHYVGICCDGDIDVNPAWVSACVNSVRETLGVDHIVP